MTADHEERDGDRDAAARWLDHALFTDGWAACVNAYTLPPLIREHENLSYLTDVADVKDRITFLISKILNAPCQTRKYGTMLEKEMFESKSQLERLQKILRSQPSGKPLNPDQQRKVNDFHAYRERRVLFKRIVLASLLGNWRHVGASRLTGEPRDRLIALLIDDDNAAGTLWFQILLHQAHMVVVWCVREFLVHTLLEYHGLRLAISHFFHFQQLKQITGEAMAAIRRYIQQNMARSWSTLGQWRAPPPPLDKELCWCIYGHKNQKKGSAKRAPPPCHYDGADCEWARDMQTLSLPFHVRMLAACYHKPDTSTVAFFLGKAIREVAPLVKRRLTAQEQSDNDQIEKASRELDAEEEEEDAMRDLVVQTYGDRRVTNLNKQMFDDLVGPDVRKRAHRKDAHRQDMHAVARVFEYITPKQFAPLHRLSTEPGQTVDGIVRLAFGHLGVEPSIVDFVLTLLRHCRTGSATRRERIRQTRLLHECHPHAYNLLQIACELLKHAQTRQVTVVGYMSANAVEEQLCAVQRRTLDVLLADDEQRLNAYAKCITRAQAKARKHPEKWSLMIEQLQADRKLFEQRIERITEAFEANPIMEMSGMCLLYCAVCSAVYSNIRNPHAPHKRFYRWGTREALRNVARGTLHCRRGKINHLGRCADVPLRSEPLLGVRVVFERKAYQLCSKCSDVMVSPPT